MRRITGAVLAIALVAIVGAAIADETSTGDKLRLLYSKRFHFTDDGLPLITIEIASARQTVTLSGDGGVQVRPDGDGGATVGSSATTWKISVEDARPGEIQQWTVVETLGPDDRAGVDAAVACWKKRGYDPHIFEVGTLFGVDGEVIDSRQVLVAVDPVAAPGGAARAAAIAKKYSVTTSVHAELVRRPTGTIVARGGDTIVRNPSVIWFAPTSDDATLTVDDIEVGGGGSQLSTKREARHYFGSIYVTLGADAALVVVNAVPEDRFLAGLVPSEMYPDAPDEALDAQAIAARTELLQKVGTRHLTDPYLLCSTQHCQVYSGAGHEHARTTRAVARTRGKVLLRDGGGLADARYSASCGGHSENNDWIWGGDPDPSLRGSLDAVPGTKSAKKFVDGITDETIEAFLAAPVTDFWENKSKWAKGRLRWTETRTAAELDALVAASYPKLGAVRALEPVSRGVSGRIQTLRIRGSKSDVEVSGDLVIRRLLGGLKSTLFVVDVEREGKGDDGAPTRFTFRGAGFGHGVGMSQLGAIGMAEGGKDCAAILEHYYPGTHTHTLY